MKPIFLSITFIVLGYNAASAQKIKETDVPKTVVSSFHNNFKNATVKEWEKEGEHYEAEFDWNKTETSATFGNDGTLLETEVEIKIIELPKAISEYVAKNYNGGKITEASRITSTNGTVSYEAEIKHGKEELDLIFDSNGSFVKKETEAYNDNEKD